MKMSGDIFVKIHLDKKVKIFKLEKLQVFIWEDLIRMQQILSKSLVVMTHLKTTTNGKMN